MHNTPTSRWRWSYSTAVIVDDEPDERGNVMAMAIGRVERPWDEQPFRLAFNAN